MRFWQGGLVQWVDLVQRSVKSGDQLLPPLDFPLLLQLVRHLPTFLFPSSSTLDCLTLFTSNGSSLQAYGFVGIFSRVVALTPTKYLTFSLSFQTSWFNSLSLSQPFLFIFLSLYLLFYLFIYLSFSSPKMLVQLAFSSFNASCTSYYRYHGNTPDL